jgi:hypothetical protein
MADIPVQYPALTAVAPVINVGASGGDKFLNNGRVKIRLTNTSGAQIDVTFVAQKACSDGTVHSVVVAVPATTGIRVLGPLPTDRFNIIGGADHGKTAMTYGTNPPTNLGIELVGIA